MTSDAGRDRREPSGSFTGRLAGRDGKHGDGNASGRHLREDKQDPATANRVVYASALAFTGLPMTDHCASSVARAQKATTF